GEQRGLAAAVWADDGDPLAAAHLDVHRTEREGAAPDDRPGQAGHHLAAGRAGPERQLQLPAAPGLLDIGEPLDRALAGPDLRRLLLGALDPGAARGAVLVAGLALLPAHPLLRPRPLRAHALGEPRPLAVRLAPLLGLAGERVLP